MKLLWLLSLVLLTAPTEVLVEGGVHVSFEVTGDESQIKAFKKNILPEVKRILGDLSSDLGEVKSQKAKIFFYSPETYHKKFPHTIDTRIPAFYRRGEVHARADNDVNHALKKTLRHELTHFIVDYNYGRVPAWLNEGLAMYEERKITIDPVPNNIDYNTLHVAKQDGKYVPLARLESQAIFGRSHGTVTSGLAYTTAYVAVYELQAKHGMRSIRRFLQEIGKRKTAEAAFLTAFGTRYSDFDDQLLKVAKKKS